MGDIATKGNRLTKRKGPHGHASQPHLSVHAKGGRAGKFGGGRTNLLEQLGRVEAEPSNPNRRAEISRVHGELNRGYAKGGRAGFGLGSIVAKGIKKALKPKGVFKPKKKVYPETEDLTHQKGPYVGDVGSERKRAKKIKWEKPDWSKRPKRPKRPDYKTLPSRPERPDYKTLPSRPKDLERQRIPDEVIEHFKKRQLGVGGREVQPPKGQEGLWTKEAFKKGGKADKKWIQKAVNPKHKGYCTPMTKKTCTPARKALARTFKKKAKTGWG